MTHCVSIVFHLFIILNQGRTTGRVHLDHVSLSLSVLLTNLFGCLTGNKFSSTSPKTSLMERGACWSAQGQCDTSLALYLALKSVFIRSPTSTGYDNVSVMTKRSWLDMIHTFSEGKLSKQCDRIIVWCLRCDLFYPQITRINKFPLKTLPN